MSADRDVAPRPNNVREEGKHSMCPPLVASNCPLKNKFVDLKEKPVVLRIGVRRLPLVRASQNDVANTDQFGGLNRAGGQVS
jgi:hypothetical protein